MINARQATRLVSCPTFNPMPFRHSDEFGDWLDLTKIKLGRWNPGLFRNVTSSDVPVTGSRWDRTPVRVAWMAVPYFYRKIGGWQKQGTPGQRRRAAAREYPNPHTQPRCVSPPGSRLVLQPGLVADDTIIKNGHAMWRRKAQRAIATCAICLGGPLMDELEPRLGSSSPQAGPAFSQDPSAKPTVIYRS